MSAGITERILTVAESGTAILAVFFPISAGEDTRATFIHPQIRHSASSARRLTHSSTDFFSVSFVIFVVQIARALGGGVEIIAGVSH